MPRAASVPAPPPAPAASPPIAPALLAWYDRSRRRLPWRALPGQTPDPYAVWLSEIMLQQTTVAAVIPYYGAFLARWPRVADLAAAPVEEVMRAWAGLGYYSRARNLHAAAIAVCRDHGGAFPDTEAALRTLPGIGAYTAAAIAAIAFGRDTTVVDGNVERVMARLHAVAEPPAVVKPLIRAKMAEATPPGRAGDFAQAVMDLGATICIPKSPACTICPLTGPCRARREGLQAVLPRRRQKQANPMRYGQAFYLRGSEGTVLVRRRPPTGLLGGMVELPGTGWCVVATEPAPPPPLPQARYAGRVTHTFTHFTLFLDVFVAGHDLGLPPDQREGCWKAEDGALDAEALPTLMRNAIALARRSADYSSE